MMSFNSYIMNYCIIYTYKYTMKDKLYDK